MSSIPYRMASVKCVVITEQQRQQSMDLRELCDCFSIYTANKRTQAQGYPNVTFEILRCNYYVPADHPLVTAAMLKHDMNLAVVNLDLNLT